MTRLAGRILLEMSAKRIIVLATLRERVSETAMTAQDALSAKVLPTASPAVPARDCLLLHLLSLRLLP